MEIYITQKEESTVQRGNHIKDQNAKMSWLCIVSTDVKILFINRLLPYLISGLMCKLQKTCSEIKVLGK